MPAPVALLVCWQCREVEEAGALHGPANQVADLQSCEHQDVGLEAGLLGSGRCSLGEAVCRVEEGLAPPQGLVMQLRGAFERPRRAVLLVSACCRPAASLCQDLAGFIEALGVVQRVEDVQRGRRNS